MHSYSYLLSVLLKLSVLYFRASELSLSRRFVYLSLDLGFYVNDEEVENWLFGEGTNEAVLTFQATSLLDETGVPCALSCAPLPSALLSFILT